MSMFYDLLMAQVEQKVGPEPIWCEYLETTGTQWIDTGVTGTSTDIDYNITMKIASLTEQVTTYPILFGSRSQTGSTNRFYVVMAQSGGRIYVGDGNGESNLNVDVVGKNVFTKKGNSLYRNSTELIKYYNTFEVFPMALMTGYFDNDKGTTGQRCTVGKLYSAQFYNKGKMIRNFRPCLHPETLRPSMYDTVGKKYYYNEGTGEFRYRLGFTKLDRIENVTTDKISIPVRMNNGDIGVWDYTKSEFTPKAGKGYFKGYQVGKSIESNGYQYIETGFVPHSKSAMQLNFELMGGNPATSWYVIGGTFNPTNKQVRFQLAFNKLQNYANFGYGAGGLLANPVDFVPHEAIIDGYHKECLYDGNKVAGTMKEGDLDINKSDIYLFKTNQPSSILVNVRISTGVFAKDGVLTHNLIAVKKDNFIGMLDTITMKEHSNMGSRDFIFNE